MNDTIDNHSQRTYNKLVKEVQTYEKRIIKTHVQ